MKTDAVMCMALMSAMPSRTSLSFKAASTCGVILRNARRPSVSDHSSLRKDLLCLSDCPSNRATISALRAYRRSHCLPAFVSGLNLYTLPEERWNWAMLQPRNKRKSHLVTMPTRGRDSWARHRLLERPLSSIGDDLLAGVLRQCRGNLRHA